MSKHHWKVKGQNETKNQDNMQKTIQLFKMAENKTSILENLANCTFHNELDCTGGMQTQAWHAQLSLFAALS